MRFSFILCDDEFMRPGYEGVSGRIRAVQEWCFEVEGIPFRGRGKL
jgi:hypothetical protein